jgi:hypothetical protein
MERFAAEKFCLIASKLASVTSQFGGDRESVRQVWPKELHPLAARLEEILPDLQSIGLKTASLQVVDAVNRLRNQGKWVSAQVVQLLICINVAINSEMSTHGFRRVFPEREDFYENPALFGVKVEHSFSEASRDIRSAGSCYAADRNTACVMHLMRVLELGLNALAERLSVKFGRREWENVINDIEAAIAKINGPYAGLDWREQQRFYAEAAKDFRYFKNAWRNHAMHAREHYDAGDARMILDHVKAFMVHLAESKAGEEAQAETSQQ